MYDGIMAETIKIAGHGGDEIAAYFARPLGPGPYPGVVVIHHMPGWDEATKEIARRFATHGYSALCPNLFYREGPDASPDDAAAAARAAGGAPGERVVGDVDGSRRFLLSLVNANNKVGVIGYCSGGRQTYLSACRLPFDAAVDCYGAFVVGSSPEGFPVKMEAVVGLTGDLSCPLLGLFGAEDQAPSPEHVAEIEAALKEHGKTYEFHSYEGAGHGFFATDRRSGSGPGSTATWPPEEDPMCSYVTEKTEIAGSGKGPEGWFRLNSATVYFDHPFHAPYEHTLNIDFVDNTAGPRARVAVELSAESARELVRCIESALAAAGPAAELA